MTRSLLIALKIAVLVVLAVYLANHPGSVTIEWFGWRVEEAPVGLLILCAVILAAVAALIYRFWRFLYRAPGSLGRIITDSKRKRGYKALSNGMVAVAAGDAAEAARWARRADSLLEEPPLTLLLSAQAAQLGGDENAAKRYFEAMLERKETRFMGLRGLVMQALREGNDPAALTYLRQAKQMRPKTPWVLKHLFEVGERSGALEEAEEALKIAARAGALPSPDAKQKRGLLQLKQAMASKETGDNTGAWRLARAARKLLPDHLAANLTAARLALVSGNPREAVKAAETAWASSPHPELARIYRDAQRDLKPVDYLKRLARLTGRNPDHRESHLALAEASLAAGLWGETRRHLDNVGGDAPTARACRLMAQLAQSEHGDGEAARHWLERALSAPPDPTWVCGSCGANTPTWSLHCPACKGLDSLAWRHPRHVQLGHAELAPPVLAPAEKGRVEASGSLIEPDRPSKAKPAGEAKTEIELTPT